MDVIFATYNICGRDVQRANAPRLCIDCIDTTWSVGIVHRQTDVAGPLAGASGVRRGQRTLQNDPPISGTWLSIVMLLVTGGMWFSSRQRALRHSRE